MRERKKTLRETEKPSPVELAAIRTEQPTWSVSQPLSALDSAAGDSGGAILDSSIILIKLLISPLMGQELWLASSTAFQV